MRAPTSSPWSNWLVEVVDEMRFAPRIRPRDARDKVLVEKLQIIDISRFLLRFCLLSWEHKIVVNFAAHALIKDIDIEIDACGKFVRFRHLVRIAEAAYMQLRIFQVDLIIWITGSFILLTLAARCLHEGFVLNVAVLSYDETTCLASFHLTCSARLWFLVDLGPWDWHILWRSKVAKIVLSLRHTLVLKVDVHD